MAKKQTSISQEPIFRSLDDLKKFLEWAKETGILRVKAMDVEVEFSPISLLPKETLNELTNVGGKTLAESEPGQEKEDEDLLFFSS